MRQAFLLITSLIISLFSFAVVADEALQGVKGQNYDKIVVENPDDGEVNLVATIRTVSTLPGSSSTIVVTDNGQNAFGPQTESLDAYKRRISIKGKGKHELVLICENTKSAAVYCSLDAERGG